MAEVKNLNKLLTVLGNLNTLNIKEVNFLAVFLQLE